MSSHSNQQQQHPLHPQQQQQLRNDSVPPVPLPPIREACAGTISFQQNKIADYVVLPPLTPSPLTSATTPTNTVANTTTTPTTMTPTPSTVPHTIISGTDDPNTNESLTEAVATCTLLCQEIEQLRRGWTEWTVQDRETNLNQLSRAAQALLHTLRKDTQPDEDGIMSSSFKEQANLASASSIASTSASSTSASASAVAATSSSSVRGEPLSTQPEYVMIRRARNLQDSIGNKKTTIGQRCHSCHTNETPEWRRGPDGARTLCNACGLHYSKLVRRGSLTVQHNYAIEDTRSGSDRSTPPPPSTAAAPPPPRVIEYPVRDISPARQQHSSQSPDRVGLAIGISSSSSSSSNLISSDHQHTHQQHQQHQHPHHHRQQQQHPHHTSFINYVSLPPPLPAEHRPKDDPP
ncbi:hypothetical protein BDB00DRAFT_868124 [Zychaea mexicana]|uniref:uncharacterized protein n=1 Tax=Zychaea mexicana TaxID=64656 RepID=UPI0022FE4806|nr:uncharacterized protein BDB00DRAFT_868124 [Zychaea mexicana]KAI9497991.1 hypothetical protein BDB00DRAFT_868124 [Zychaea mexicana]